MKLTLVRHAEVDEKFTNCYNGHNEIGLSDFGNTQAKDLCQKLDMLKFDAIFSSDTFRAKESLKHSLHVDKTTYTKELREKSWGKHEGMSFDEIIAQNEVKYENFLQWISALDGEDYNTYVKRIEKFFLEFLPSLEHNHVLIVTHAGVIRVLISIINNISLEDAFGIKVEHCSLISYKIKHSGEIVADT